MENRVTAADRILLRNLLRVQVLICAWLRDYPYKRYPKEKFYRRFTLLKDIEGNIKKELKENGHIF